MNQKESEEEIKLLLKQIEKKVSRFPLELENNKNRAKSEIESLIEVASLEIETYCLEYEEGEERGGRTETFKRELMNFKTNIENSFNDFCRKNDEEKQNRLNTKKKMKDLQKTELIGIGDEMQMEGINKLQMMNKNLGIGNEILEDVNVELLRQQEKLLVASEHTKDMLSVTSKIKLIDKKEQKN